MNLGNLFSTDRVLASTLLPGDVILDYGLRSTVISITVGQNGTILILQELVSGRIYDAELPFKTKIAKVTVSNI